jgi:hypothetical protein
MRVGLNLRVNLIVAPLVVAMLALALAPIASYLSLRAALHDVRREIAFLLHLSRLDILAVRQSAESFGAAFRGEDAGELREVESEARAAFDALAGWDFPPRRAARAFAFHFYGIDLPRVGEGDPELLNTPQFRDWLDQAVRRGAGQGAHRTGANYYLFSHLARGDFPLSYQRTAGRVGWRESDIERWIATRRAPKFGAHRGKQVARLPPGRSSSDGAQEAAE